MRRQAKRRVLLRCIIQNNDAPLLYHPRIGVVSGYGKTHPFYALAFRPAASVKIFDISIAQNLHPGAIVRQNVGKLFQDMLNSLLQIERGSDSQRRFAQCLSLLAAFLFCFE